MRKSRRRTRPSLPFLLLSAAVVFIFFALAAIVGADNAAELPEATVAPYAERVTPSPSEAATLEDKPAPYIPDKAEVEMLARLIWGEARGVASDMEKAAVAWCVLNRVDADGWPDTVDEVVTQPFQFVGYSPDYPATEELKALAADVLTRWEREKREGGDAGRVLPAEYAYFTGDGERNYFRTEYRGGVYWDWTLNNPYSD